MPDEVQRHFAGFLFMAAACVCLLIAGYQAYSERIEGGNWQPRPFTLGWRLVMVLLALFIFFVRLGIDFWVGQIRLDAGMVVTGGLVAVTLVSLFLKFARPEV